ncbi:VirC1-like protein [Leptospira kirschneri str. 200801774]|uniref:ParA family protein n=1 Tax=Leptospira kirschneri TaxID=29507 RepID=UPI0002BFDB94|nr:AAA family ATPase [Leptospira kirschneri]EMO80438.1 VirC1-like protein [Leptospira kirschneri str. 200801774]
MKIIPICSGKGGVGKTTTTIYLAQTLVHLGKKVLVIDYDFNRSLSKFMFTHFQKNEEEAITKNSYKMLFDDDSYERYIIKSTAGLDFIPAIERLKKVDIDFYDDLNLKYRFEKLLRSLNYEFVLLDLHNVVNVVLIAAIHSADHVISPMEYGSWSIDGTDDMLKVFKDIKSTIKKKIKFTVVPSRVSNSKLDELVEVCEHNGLNVSAFANINDNAVHTASNLGEFLNPKKHKAFERFLILANEVSNGRKK